MDKTVVTTAFGTIPKVRIYMKLKLWLFHSVIISFFSFCNLNINSNLNLNQSCIQTLLAHMINHILQGKQSFQDSILL